LEKVETPPVTSNFSVQQECDIRSQSSIPLKATKSDDTFKSNSPSQLKVSTDCYKTRNIQLDNTSVQSFEETLYLGALKPTEPMDSSHGSCTSEKSVNNTVESGDKQTVESEAIKIAQEW